MTSSNRPLALVAGDISMVRALGRQGIPVALATSETDAPILHSRYCRSIVRIPSWVSDPDGAVDALIRWARTQPSKPVLFYQGDHDLVAVSRSRDRLAEVFSFVLPPAGLVDALTDKLKFEDLARERELPVPRTLRLRPGDDVRARLRDWTDFPAVLKPSMRTNWYSRIGCLQKALRVQSRAELDEQLALIGSLDIDLLVQAAVEGGEDRIVSYHAYVRPDGSIAAEFTGRKVRTFPRLYGISSHVTITDDREVLQAGRSVVGRLGFTGVLKADFKIDERDERMFLLEINPRFNLWHHPGTVAGVPIPQIVYEDCTGVPRRREAPRLTGAGVRWVDPVLDWMACKEYCAAGELTRGRWLVQLVTAAVNEGFTWRDPMPGLVALRARIDRRLARWFGHHAVRADR
jgi:predicted ATP-grasp superfamily ATP-dependent carboligase